MWNDSRGLCKQANADDTSVAGRTWNTITGGYDVVNPPTISEGSSDSATLQVIAEQEIKRINQVA